MIHCANCGRDFADSFKICPYCNTPVAPENMSDTAHVMSAVKEIYVTYGMDTIRNKQRFISILRDYIPEYEKEMRLLITAIENDIVDNLSREGNNVEPAIARARTFMESELFLSKVAIEFIIQVVTYMFGWEYKPPVEEKVATPTAPTEPIESKETDAESTKTKSAKPTENKVFTSAEATKFRLKGNVEIPSGYTAIKGFAFDEFALLKNVTIPEGVVAIGEYAFSNCSRLTTVKLPSTLRFIKTSAFEACTKLTEIEIPRGVVAIEDGTFQFCESLEKVVIPDTVGSIGASAFSCCDNLKSIKIPDSVKYIGESVFDYCSDIVVQCYEYSYVHKYCQSAGINFSLLKD
jgi:hypothetical protein